MSAAVSFSRALSDAIERQYDRFEPYRMLCQMQGVERADLRAFVDAGESWRVPTIPADWFKREKSNGLFRQLSIPGDGGAWLLSSSTSGDHSYVWRTTEDMDAIKGSFDRLWRTIWVERALFFAPPAEFLASTGGRVAIDERPTWPYAYIPLRHAEEAVFPELHWILEPRPGEAPRTRHDTLIEHLERAESEQHSIGLCMSVLALYPAVRSLPRSYDLGRNAFVLTGAGGWDGKKGTAVGDPIDKPTFVREVAERLGIPEASWSTQFLDGYGTSENGRAQTGRYSDTHRDFVYASADDAVVYVIDPVTEAPVGPGGRGYPRVVSPYGHEGAATVSVQQADLVTAVATNPDGSVQTFTHITRSGATAQDGGVGCALTMVEEVSA